MDISKWHKLFVSLLLTLISCERDEFFVSNNSFDRIIINNWKSVKKPNKIILETYRHKSNFKIKEEKYGNFEILLDTIGTTLFLTPKTISQGKINTDLKLTVDSLVYEISNIKSSRDTLIRSFGIGRELYIFNAIDTLNINGEISINKGGGSADIYLSMGGAKIIKNSD